MAKFNSSNILKILRKFNQASDDNVPRQVEDLKRFFGDEFSEIFSFKFLNAKFLIIVDGMAEDDEFYIRELIHKNFGELEGELLENPLDSLTSFALPFEGKDIYAFKIVSSKARLDVILSEQFPDISRSTIQKYIKNGQAKINQKVCLKPKTLVGKFDKVELDIPEKSAEKQDFKIIFEDENVIVIDKPRGVLTHSKGALNDEYTVADFFADHGATFANGTNRAGVVHRLDRETSGVIIGAKNDSTASKLQKQFSDRTARKVYFAVVKGTPAQPKALIDLPISRNQSSPSTFMVHPKGKPAQTAYELISANGEYSLVKLMPKTGRTHQLRVHMSYIGNPILGDKVYDKSISKSESLERMFLHASELEITIPPKNGENDSQRKIFESPAPEEFYKKVS